MASFKPYYTHRTRIQEHTSDRIIDNETEADVTLVQLSIGPQDSFEKTTQPLFNLLDSQDSYTTSKANPSNEACGGDVKAGSSDGHLNGRRGDSGPISSEGLTGSPIKNGTSCRLRECPTMSSVTVLPVNKGKDSASSIPLPRYERMVALTLIARCEARKWRRVAHYWEGRARQSEANQTSVPLTPSVSDVSSVSDPLPPDRVQVVKAVLSSRDQHANTTRELHEVRKIVIERMEERRTCASDASLITPVDSSMDAVPLNSAIRKKPIFKVHATESAIVREKGTASKISKPLSKSQSSARPILGDTSNLPRLQLSTLPTNRPCLSYDAGSKLPSNASGSGSKMTIPVLAPGPSYSIKVMPASTRPIVPVHGAPRDNVHTGSSTHVAQERGTPKIRQRSSSSRVVLPAPPPDLAARSTLKNAARGSQYRKTSLPKN